MKLFISVLWGMLLFAPTDCLFSKEEVDQIKNDVKSFLKGLNVNDEKKIGKAVGLVSKAQALADAGMSEKYLKIVLLQDAMNTAQDIGVDQGAVLEGILKQASKRTTKASFSNFTCPTISITANLHQKDAATTFLNTLQDNQLNCVPANIMEVINAQAVIERVKGKSNTADFIKVVKAAKEGEISTLNTTKEGYTNSIQQLKTLGWAISTKLEKLGLEGEKFIETLLSGTNICPLTAQKREKEEEYGDRVKDVLYSYVSNAKVLEKDIEKVFAITSNLSSRVVSLKKTVLPDFVTPLVKELKKLSDRNFTVPTIYNDNSCKSSIVSKVNSLTMKPSIDRISAISKSNITVINELKLNRSLEFEYKIHKAIQSMTTEITTLINDLETKITALNEEIKALETVL